MADLIAHVRSLPLEHQDVALDILDLVTRPLTAREIEAALRVHGIPKPRAAMFGNVLRKLAIVAVVGENDRG